MVNLCQNLKLREGAIAQYLGCADNVPLSQKVAELEAKVEELQALVKK